MRKVKLTVQCRVPSWNFCNLDEYTTDGRYSKDLCRFCKTTKRGSYCMLHDKMLTSDGNFVRKTDGCIDATAGYAITADEHVGPKVDPKLIIKETLKNYKKTVKELLSQGYPRDLAETIATKYVSGEQ